MRSVVILRAVAFVLIGQIFINISVTYKAFCTETVKVFQTYQASVYGGSVHSKARHNRVVSTFTGTSSFSVIYC